MVKNIRHEEVAGVGGGFMMMGIIIKSRGVCRARCTVMAPYGAVWMGNGN